MPNYLTKASGRPNASAKTGKKYEADVMYQTRIFNQDYTIDFTGRMPEDFALSLAGNWGEGLESAFMDAVNKAAGKYARTAEVMAQATGLSTRAQMASARTWEAPSYLNLSIPISLSAYGNTQEEVIERLKKLLNLTAPRVKGGMFQSPGPSPVKNVISQFGGSFASGLADNLQGEILTVQVGTFFTMTPVIVTGVNASFDGLMEHGTGNPISVSVQLDVESFFAVSRNEIEAWLHGGGGK